MGKESRSTVSQCKGTTEAPIAAHHHFATGAPRLRSSNQLTRSAKNKKLFPQKLWDLINDDKYNFCLRWSDDGQLVYLNRDQFEDSYLKTSENQFHTQKAISFVRQMNMYGFRKVDDCYYENDNFKRNCDHLLKNMIRKHPNKGASPQTIHNLACHIQELNNQQSTLATSNTCSEASSVILGTTGNHHRPQNEQKELLLLNQYQQQQANNNTQLPTDLTMTQESRHLNNLQLQSNSENNNLNVLYTLLASINSNLYQPPLLNQQHVSQASNNQSLNVNNFTELQQVYQHIFEQLLYKTSV